MNWRRGPGGRYRVAAAVAAGALVAGLAAGASADVADSRKCRTAIGKEVGKLEKTVLKNIDGCHKAQDKAASSGAPCNQIGSPEFDPKLKYPTAKTKGTEKIDKACLPGDPVLGNYPGLDVENIYPIYEENSSGNSVLVLGNANLGGGKTFAKCLEAIAKNRSGIINEIVKDSTKCQAGLDKTGTTFGAIDPSCVDAADKSAPKALTGIPKACPGVNPDDIGSCSPLPQCAIDASIAAGQSIARSIYSLPASPVCGNGIIEFPEQCDDNNTTGGDGCSAVCELEGFTCTPFVATRTVTLTLHTPTPLAAVDITLDYPQLESGIPGTGQSSAVQSAFTVLQSNPVDLLFQANDRETDVKMTFASASPVLDTGDLVRIAFDGCLDPTQNICNRNQNVTQCCNGDGDDPGGANCVFAPPVCATFPAPPTLGPGNLEDCCPADNACVTQLDATACNVSNPVDEFLNPVDGVTCTVAISQP